MRALLLLCLFPLASLAEAPKTLAEFEEAYQFECNAPFENFDMPDAKEHEGFTYEHTGATVKVRRLAKRKGSAAKLGLLAGMKDAEPETKALVEKFLADFDKADVDVVVVGGDSAEEPAVLEQVFAWLATATKRPIVAIAGNSERAAAMNYAILKVRKTGADHLLDMDLIRRFDGDGFDLVSVAGYYDRAYLHASGACIYTDKHLDGAEAAAKASDDPVVLLSHGPPRMKGQAAIDFVPGADNVGDPKLTELITRAKIPFGVFGHILEAGGKASELSGKLVPPKKPSTQLYVNQGSANPLPWKLNDGTTSYGLAAIMSIEGKKASYEVLKGAKPAPKAVKE